MPDKKLTDSEIVKALEDCIKHTENCFECPSYEFCDKNDSKVVMVATLDLINRLQAENERLKNDLAISRKETKRYKNSYQQCAYEREMFLNELNDAKAEAYKEFAEKLKENVCGDYEIYEKCSKNMRSFDYQQGYADYNNRLVWYIDNLLKELVNEEN